MEMKWEFTSWGKRKWTGPCWVPYHPKTGHSLLPRQEPSRRSLPMQSPLIFKLPAQCPLLCQLPWVLSRFHDYVLVCLVIYYP